MNLIALVCEDLFLETNSCVVFETFSPNSILPQRELPNYELKLTKKHTYVHKPTIKKPKTNLLST